MRQNRRHFRVLSGNKNHGMPIDVNSGSRLADGTFVRGHDPWNCVRNMLHTGWFAGIGLTNVTFLIERAIATMVNYQERVTSKCGTGNRHDSNRRCLGHSRTAKEPASEPCDWQRR
jgi:hypothetical protein